MTQREAFSKDKGMQSSLPICAEEISKQFIYDPSTGLITRRIRASQMKAGSIAGTKSASDGYVKVRFNRRLILAHRMAWTLFYQESPIGFIDHINNDRSDNRINNLRLASKQQNNHNSLIRKDNKLGIKGVHYNQRDKRFTAQIKFDNKRICLGNFLTANEAAIAYNNAAMKLHGEFAPATRHAAQLALVAPIKTDRQDQREACANWILGGME